MQSASTSRGEKERENQYAYLFSGQMFEDALQTTLQDIDTLQRPSPVVKLVSDYSA